MAYRVTEARLERDQAQREHILDCALQQVAEGGFASLSMTGLASAAGIATGSLYRHFSGKGALAAEVFTRATRIEFETLKSQFMGTGSAEQRLRRGLAQFAARAWHSRQLAFALIAEPVEAEVDTQRLRFREAYAEIYCKLIREGSADGSFQVDNIPLTAACLVGAVAEALVGPLSPQARAARASGLPSESLESVTRAIIRFSLRALGAKEINA
ncbi:TetR/AcrR family transcriptional regulator [Halopseudomonas phragmitis]|uniref:TetR family transcriptional regulator n=2 Tax=Pseudomonadaceae TaxID=135621 RepID=A0A1V0B573_9GAMM|nr:MULTISPECIES: TetR/AcrR family transcriptional regulator [Pseudomonadaceae]AQZ94934.1 TetR family transcriptional regulator [Halopseudomonas phragmitis]RHW23093.1 TetR/AcrR family transcriptional regulator [Pseudomonas jilinensis]